VQYRLLPAKVAAIAVDVASAGLP